MTIATALLVFWALANAGIAVFAAHRWDREIRRSIIQAHQKDQKILLLSEALCEQEDV